MKLEEQLDFQQTNVEITVEVIREDTFKEGVDTNNHINQVEDGSNEEMGVVALGNMIQDHVSGEEVVTIRGREIITVKEVTTEGGVNMVVDLPVVIGEIVAEVIGETEIKILVGINKPSTGVTPNLGTIVETRIGASITLEILEVGKAMETTGIVMDNRGTGIRSNPVLLQTSSGVFNFR